MLSELLKNKKFCFIAFVLFLLVIKKIQAQDTLVAQAPYKANMHFSFAGSSYIYAISYERIIFRYATYTVSATVGIAPFFKPLFPYNSLSLPMGISGLLGKKNIRFYHSICFNPLVFEGPGYTYKNTVSAGVHYAFQKRFFIRAYPCFIYDDYFKTNKVFYGLQAGVWF